MSCEVLLSAEFWTYIDGQLRIYMSISKRITVRVALVGACEVGKTSILLRAMGKPVPEKYVATIGIDSGVYRCVQEDQYVTLKMWDCSGDERFGAIIPRFLRDSKFVLFCFDLSRPETFQSVKKYVELVDSIMKSKPYTACVVGLKKDLEVPFPKQQVKDYAEMISATYYEVNASHESEVIFLMHSIAKDAVVGGNFIYEVPEEDEEDIIVHRQCPCM